MSRQLYQIPRVSEISVLGRRFAESHEHLQRDPADVDQEESDDAFSVEDTFEDEDESETESMATQDLLTLGLDNVRSTIPATIVTLWAGIWGVLMGSSLDQSVFLSAAFVVMLLIPGYLYATIDRSELHNRRSMTAFGFQCVAAMMAFVVWTYYLAASSEAPITVVPLDLQIASILILLFPAVIAVLPLYALAGIWAYKYASGSMTVQGPRDPVY